jgi:hypothetical protein
MLGVNVKRGVATTLERVFNASGERMGELEVLWSGKTAGIIFDRRNGRTDAKVIFPAIDEKSDVPHTTFNNLIGYALHELGHAWYTDNKPWDRARAEHGAFVGALINGLEDPRIERCVIESGRAPNARALFENLLNSILTKDGYIEPDDKKNIPFLLAVEGRRMNGYAVCVDSIVEASPWKKDIKWALKRAHKATDTASIVKIAVELFKRLSEKEEEQGQGDDGQDGNPQPPQGEPQDGEGGQPQDGEPPQTQPTDDPADGQDGANGQGEGDPSDGDEQGDGDGSDGSDGDDTNGQDSTDGNPADGDGDPTEGDGQDGDPSDEPPSKGNGKSESLEGGREVEPSDFIEGELDKHSTAVDDKRSRPSFGKPEIATFTWS